jgi:hypothetical protein
MSVTEEADSGEEATEDATAWLPCWLHCFLQFMLRGSSLTYRIGPALGT